MTEIKRGDFLRLEGGFHPGLQDSAQKLIRTGGEIAVEVTVRAVNELKDVLGFGLTMTSKPSGKYRDCTEITFLPSQPVHHDFFSPFGIFCGAWGSIGMGISMVKEVSSQDAKTIFLAEMAGIDTMQIISEEKRGPSGDGFGQWQSIMGYIAAALQAASAN